MGGKGAGLGRGASAEKLEGPIPGQCGGGELFLHSSSFFQFHFENNLLIIHITMSNDHTI